MANVNSPFGFKPVKRADGSAFSGQVETLPLASGYATAIAFGDPVALLNDGTIGIGVAGSAILGIFAGVEYTDTLGNRVIRPNWVASTATLGSVNAKAKVITDNMVVYEVQETDAAGAAGTALALTDVGQNINFRIGTPTSQGYSTSSINNASENTTDTLNCKIIALSDAPGNVVGSYAKWYVLINNHSYKAGVTGV